MKKILLSLILVGIVSSVFLSMQASEEPVTADAMYKLRFGTLQEKIYPTPEYTAAVQK